MPATSSVIPTTKSHQLRHQIMPHSRWERHKRQNATDGASKLGAYDSLIPSDKSFFRIQEVANILSVPVQTVYSWTRGKNPILPTVKIGKVRLVGRNDLLAVLNHGKAA